MGYASLLDDQQPGLELEGGGGCWSVMFDRILWCLADSRVPSPDLPELPLPFTPYLLSILY